MGHSVFSKGQKIQPAFILIYALGVLFLVTDGWQNHLLTLALLNLLSLFIALAVWYKQQA
ncbi:hypothetical protein M1563_01585 [Patescibacteria group bacterium]|nr:hypothetical protein [Patescibacteria group bacterium]MCL5409977.1 hypothetical protein [Patescibacteria group bacterium]